MRICKSCHISQSLGEYPKNPRSKDGRQQPCKACTARRKSIQRKANRQHESLVKAAWRRAHPEEWQAETARYRTKNREKLRIAELARRRAQPEEIRARRNKTPPEKRLAWSRQWRRANPERNRELSSRYRARRQNAPQIENIDRMAIYMRDKWICQLCFTKVTLATVSLDHVIPLSKGGAHTAQNLVVAHRKCNTSKRDRAITQQMRLFG